MTMSWFAQIDSTSVADRVDLLIKHVYALEMEPFKPDGEEKAVNEFLLRSADIASFLRADKEDPVALNKLEKEMLRPLAVDLRAYTLRRNLTCCVPFWTVKPASRPNDFAVFGSTELEASVEALANPVSLSLTGQNRVGSPDRIRWDAICASNFAIFDFRRESLAEGKWASIGHALGLALSLGTMPVILADGETKLPFDIPLEPIIVKSIRDSRLMISNAMAISAIAQFPVEEEESSTLATIEYVLDRTDGRSSAVQYMRRPIEALKDAEPLDPLTSKLFLRALLDLTGRRDHVLLTPLWPGAYPKSRETRCFHILPFALPDAISRAVEAGCPPGVTYKRGDITGDLDIIRGIWRGIAQSTHVVVDLTPADINGSAAESQPNPNVCLELAMAQALGRKLLLVRDARAKAAALFPEIAKLQVLPYQSSDELKGYVKYFVATTTK